MRLTLWAPLLPALALAASGASAMTAERSVPVAEQSPSAKASDTAAVKGETGSSEPVTACKKKKKGLGGLLRAARSSGLISVVSGRAGTGGALVNSATNTAIDVVDAGTRMAPQAEKTTC